ncbi:hypothetical protein PR202_gb11367 [Eleusine coracana subsp. coracana]|uniref:Inositol hexakisphosphate and diphosphoinositol-pentakisphosphate kinase n=1 Tax=Eleusine coracana subsp. coracana TaxID=191504 RepID=A0AAV5EK12_ELECO|nr:hypothetical protein PR202_gb11367 [Eleusine coracana subsp. coracana]
MVAAEGNVRADRVTIGVCVMEKKLSGPFPFFNLWLIDRLVFLLFQRVFSSPMEQILERLRAFGEFEIIIFGDKVILNDPIEIWPNCDCLIAFYSTGFPLQKVQAYAALRREYPYQELDYFIEQEDFVEVHGKRFWKPFVEKPVNGDDHRIMIYYPSSAGGGMKELFRKVGNRSSEFHPDVRRVRREGSYIYEEFMPTGGTDVKVQYLSQVYTVGPGYAHAEARKSPVVDGVVMRNPDGKEVCGFDLLRYYDDAACILRKIFLDAKAPHLSSTIPPSLPWKSNEPVQPTEGLTRQGSGIIGTFGQSEELRCVIVVIRHGDRTPKQKVKLKVTEEKLLNLMLKYNGGKPRAETKLKSAIQLQDLLDATRQLVPPTRSGRESDSDAEDVEHIEKLRQVKAVLEEGGHFSGIYRKVQLKPLKWVKVPKRNGDGEEEQPIEALMILKYGGVLTHAGRKQAEELGRILMLNMIPLRPQMSAAAFAKGLLDLEGQLTPILVSLVSKDSSMLDGLEDASIEMDEAKAKLTKEVTAQVKLLAEGEDEKLALTNSFSKYDQAKALGKTTIDVARIAAGLPCGSESFLLMFARWRKLERDLYNERKDRFDITQIPDVYDSCK